MQNRKEKITPGRVLMLSAWGLMYAALGFSILNDGSYNVWRKTVLQTIVFLAFFLYLTARGLAGKKLIDSSLLDMPVLVLLCFVICMSFFAIHKAVAMNAVIQLSSCVCAFYLFVSMAKNRVLQTQLTVVVAGITLLLCLYGLMIHYGIYLLPEWRYINIIQRGMLCATFANHNHLAGWLEMALLLYAGYFFIRKRSLPVYIMMVCTGVIMAWTLMASLSRGGWAAAAAGGMFILVTAGFSKSFSTPKNLLPFAAGILAIVMLGVLGSGTVVERGLTIVDQETRVIPGRTIVWKGTLDMIRTVPLTGVGPGNYSLVLPQFQPPGLSKRFYEAHNDYLQFVAEMGILFIPLLVWLIVVFFKTGFRKLHHPSRQTRWITLGAMGGVVAILVHSVSDFNLQIPSNALLFTLLAAQVAAPPPPLK